MKRRQMMAMTAHGVGMLTLHACGGGASRAPVSGGPVIGIKTIAELKTIKPKYNGQQFQVLGHTLEGIGGGLFYYDAKDRFSIDDDGSIIVGNGYRYKRIQPAHPTPEMFGARVDPNIDQSKFINKCTQVYGACYLEADQIYNIQRALEVKVIKCANGLATINCMSPSGDNRFGSTTAAVRAAGSVSVPLEGVDVQNLIINCNGLIGAAGSIGIKGTLFVRLKNFYQRGCTVLNSASYGFWDTDTSEVGTIYCSGTRDDCWAVDCSVSFEQVNVRGVTLNNCHGYISNTVLNYAIECIFHPYGGDDMQIVYNNCTGISDGNCPAIFMALFKCKNVTANDCAFINNNYSGRDVRTAVYFDSSGGSFDNFTFNNCIIKSLFSPAMYLDVGEIGPIDGRFKFTDCIINGYQLGVQINGYGGTYSFLNCETTGASDKNTTPFAYYANGSLARDQARVVVIGGKAKAIGPNATATTNMSNKIYTSTFQTPPLTLIQPEIRQEKMGTGILVWNGTYSYLNISFQSRIINPDRVIISAMVNAIGMEEGGMAASWATPLSWINMDNTNFRLFASVEFAGRTVAYVMTEYE